MNPRAAVAESRASCLPRGFITGHGCGGPAGVARSLRFLITLLAFLLVLPATLSAQDQEIPTLKQYVTDNTGTLSQGETGLLESRLRAFEDSTSNQIVVLMIPTIGNEAIEDLSVRIAQANKIGVKGHDNGILLLIAKNDRKVRIEVGYGLEGALPDALCGQIIRHEIGPAFRQGDFFGGISAGVDAIMLATKGEYKAGARKSNDKPASLVPFLILIVILFVVLRNAFRPRRRFFGGFGPTMWGGPFFGGGWRGGGGGFGGGGFGGGGGFSGGGGSFGGGGASGGW